MSWCVISHRYVYEEPKLWTTNHATLPQLIEAGDVEVLETLVRAGHLPQGLQDPDELGLSPSFLAVTFDRPDVLRLLDRVGVDLSVACDVAGYGTPAFYCAYHAKVQCLEVLARLGVDLNAPCTKYGELPSHFFYRHPTDVADQLSNAVTLRDRSAVVIATLARGFNNRWQFQAKQLLIVTIQRRWRQVRALRRKVAVRNNVTVPAPSPAMIDPLLDPTEESAMPPGHLTPEGKIS